MLNSPKQIKRGRLGGLSSNCHGEEEIFSILRRKCDVGAMGISGETREECTQEEEDEKWEWSHERGCEEEEEDEFCCWRNLW